MDVFWAAPPIARTLTLAAFVLSLAVHGGWLSGQRIIFLPSLVFKIPPEPWRLLTSFLIVRGGTPFIFDLYFLYTYTSGLERGTPRFALPGDLTIYLIFVCTIIMVLAHWLLWAPIFTQALIMALTHTWAQANRGNPVTFYVIQMKAEYLPICLLIIDIVSEGWWSAYISMVGIFASHLYDFLTRLWPVFGGGTNYLKTPAFVHRLWGTTFREQRSRGLGPSGSSTAESVGSAWSMRGAGRRLGGS